MLRPEVIVVMGVSGSGKTTVGRKLAERFSVPYADADEFHPAVNIAKMSRGQSLTDQDREPWLTAIAERMAVARADGGLVVSCSALKRRYRDRLRLALPNAFFLYLAVNRNVIARRIAARKDHFMPASLVESQFKALEPLRDDEIGASVDAGRPLADVLAESFAVVRR